MSITETNLMRNDLGLSGSISTYHIMQTKKEKDEGCSCFRFTFHGKETEKNIRFTRERRGGGRMKERGKFVLVICIFCFSG